MVCPFFFWMRNAMKFNACGDAFEMELARKGVTLLKLDR